jgi:hypothetical protein
MARLEEIIRLAHLVDPLRAVHTSLVEPLPHETSVPGAGRLRLIEVKGRVKEAGSVTISKNEILSGLHTPDEFIPTAAIIESDWVDLK